MSLRDKRSFIDRSGTSPSIIRQADLLDVPRSTLYYSPVVDRHDIEIMNAIDAIYTKCPFYGTRNIRYELQTSHGLSACREHIARLMRVMGIEAIYPKPKREYTSQPSKEHVIYPHLLKHLIITHPNQVWGTDITYVRLAQGFAYLVALMDWYSRYVIAWRLSETLQEQFCLDNLNHALTIGVPGVHNSDQGSHYTSPQYTDILNAHEIQISMDGKGRCMDNIFTERLWRTVKYENIYLRSYQDVREARSGLSEYFTFYNTRRPHQALDMKTPYELYHGSKPSPFLKNDALYAPVSVGTEAR